MPDTPSNPLVHALLRRHPEYRNRLAHWQFLQECYEGGREWFEDNLFQYWKEGQDEFAARKERAYRFNHSREVVDLVNKYLFRSQVSRNKDNVPESVSTFWRNSTKDNMDIDYLMRMVSKEASIYGRVYVVVDSTRTVPTVLSKYEIKKLGMRNYAYIMSPVDVLDMSFDEQQQLIWILVRETVREDQDFEKSMGYIMERYRLWTRDGWFLYEIREVKTGNSIAAQVVSDLLSSTVTETNFEAALLDSGSHNLGRVPVIIHDNVEHNSPYYSPALINDIAYQDRAVANYLSNLDAIIQDQTFSQLAIPAQALMPGEEERTEKKMVEMGTKRVFLFNAEAGTQPMFLSPDPKQAQIIITAIKQVINEIYHSVGLAGERTKQDNSMGIDNSSGVAKAYDFERINALLSTKAKSLQRVEQQIVRLVAAWNGEDIPEDVDPLTWVKYADTFDVRGLADEFDMAANLQKVSAPDSIRRLQMGELVEKMLPVVSDAERNEIDAELQNWPSKAAPASEGGVGKLANSTGHMTVNGGVSIPIQGSVQPKQHGRTGSGGAVQ